MFISIMASIILSAAGADSTDISLMPDNWVFGYEFLFDASADGSWKGNHPVIDSTGIDASVSVLVLSPEVDILAMGAVSSDSASSIRLRRGRAVVKWPGTPWIGAGVYFNDKQPFIAGLTGPVVEWGWVDIDSIRGFGVSSGGFLDFEGEYLIQLSPEDTLSQLNVYSPWMGFAGVDYGRVQLHRTDSLSDENTTVNVLSVRGDFRYFSPWLIIAGAEGEHGRWALSGEIREYAPFNTRWGSIEIVPGIHFAGDSIEFPGDAFVPGQRIISLGAFLHSSRYFASAGLEGMLDLQSDSLSGISASAGLISEMGIRWNAVLNYYADDDYSAIVSSELLDSFASSGIAVEVINDSARVTGRASYSPRDDVCAEIRLSGDLDDSLQPACGFAVSAALGPVTGLFRIDWNYLSSPLIRIDLRGLLR